MLKTIVCRDSFGDNVVQIPIPEGCTVHILDDEDISIDIQQSGEKPPLGVAIDVYDKGNNILVEASFLYE